MIENSFERFLKGEPEAIDGIVLFYRDALIKHGLKFTPRLDVVEDAVAEAIVLLAGKIGQFEHTSQVKKHLHTTVRYKCLTATRAINRTTRLPEDMPDTTAEFRDIRESDLHSQWIIEKIKAFLPRLPEKRSRDFYAHFFESKSFKAIAVERGTTPDTVRQNVQYALKEVRKYLKDKGCPGILEES